MKFDREDFLMGIEYFYDGGAMTGLRFKMFFAGYTAWVGGRTSISTLTCRYNTDIVPRQPFEDYRDRCLDPLEVHSPAMPNEMVIGLTGLVGADKKASCMGLVVRKIEHQHLFSYNWVQDVMRRSALDASAAAIGVENNGDDGSVAIDAQSIPSRVATNDEGGFAFFDSLTLAGTVARHAEGSVESSNGRGVAESAAADKRQIKTGVCKLL